MWVSPAAGWDSVGGCSPTWRRAAARVRSVRLDTNRALTEAKAMYRSSGYDEIPPFNDERYADHWFEKSG